MVETMLSNFTAYRFFFLKKKPTNHEKNSPNKIQCKSCVSGVVGLKLNRQGDVCLRYPFKKEHRRVGLAGSFEH